MRFASFVALRGLRTNKVRTALSVLGIALGIAIVIAIHVVDHNTIQSRMAAQHPDQGQVDLELVARATRRPLDAVQASLQAHHQIQAVGFLQRTTVSMHRDASDLGTAQLFGLAPLPPVVFGHYRIAAGSDLGPDSSPHEVLIGSELAATFGLRVGERLQLALPALVPSDLCKEGERVPASQPASGRVARRAVAVKGILAHERLGRRNAGMVLVAPIALLAELDPAATTICQVDCRPGSDLDLLRRDLEAEFAVLDSRSSMLGEGADERAFRNGVKILGCLALVLGMFVVFQTLSQSLVERLRQIGLLRCLGASRRAIGGVFLLDAAFLAGLGSLLGAGLGLLLAWLLQRENLTTLGVGKPIDRFEVPWFPVVWAMVLGAVFTLAGALFPLWKARHVAPLDVLAAHGLEDEHHRDVLRGVNWFLFALLVFVLPGAYLAMTPLLAERDRETLTLLAQLLGLLVLFGGILLAAPVVVRTLGRLLLAPLVRVWRLPVFLVDRALHRSPGRFAASVSGLAVVLLAWLALGHVTAALQGEVRQYGQLTTLDRLFLEGTPTTRAAAEPLAALPLVEAVTFCEGQAAPGFELYGMAAERLAAPDGPLRDNPDAVREYRDSRVLIVSHRFALLHQVRAGSRVRVPTDQGEVLYTVLRVSDAVGFFPDERAYALAAPRWLRQDFCVPAACVGRITLRLAPGSDWQQVLASVREARPGVTRAKWGQDIVAYHLRDVTRDFVLFEILLALILALAGLGLMNQIAIAAFARLRELGVLRALGTAPGALRRAFLLEGCLIAALATVLALALAVPLGAFIVAGLNRVSGLEAPVVIPWRTFGLVPVLALCCGLVAAMVPGWRAVRQSPAEAVRYE